MSNGVRLGALVTLALASLTAGCEAAQTRIDQLAELARQVGDQVSGGGGGPSTPDPLKTSPLAARALAGTVEPAVEITPVSLEDMLQAESYFAIGSVIAKPKTDLVEPAVEPEIFDVEAADPALAAQEETDPAVDAVEPVSPALDDPTSDATPRTADIPGALRRPSPALSRPAPDAVLRKDQAVSRSLEKAARQSGVKVTEDTVRLARRSAEETLKANTRTAQQIGDGIARQNLDRKAPVPRELAVRNKLDLNAALNAREQAYSKLEELGLSGVVVPEEGGQMRIVIGVSPTQFRPGADLASVPQMSELFARNKESPEDECRQNPTRSALQADPVLATECVVKVLMETGDYEYVEKDFIFTNQLLKRPNAAQPGAATVARIVPNDPLFGLQWNLKDTGAAGGQSPGGAGFSGFWTRARSTGSRSVTVAVIDTGIQMSHPDISGSRNLAPGFDMVSDPMMGNDGDGRDPDPNDPGDRCDPSDPTSRDTFHGTHVAGTIGLASSNNANGVAGGAWDVTIVPVRALGRCGGRLSDINDAIRWAAGRVPARDGLGNEVWNQNPADIINLSIGLFEPCPASMQSAINDAVAAGSIVVAAAGNARIDTRYFAPGGCQNVISVAAGDGRGMLAPYSNYGADVDIMAPGGDMTRDDDGDGRPDGILSTKFSRNCYDPASPGVSVAECFYAYENGTSMAAPHVSAALALLKARYPSAVPSELRSRLLTASSPRTPLQCSGACSSYPGSQPIPGQSGQCSRPCGGIMLNLGNAQMQ